MNLRQCRATGFPVGWRLHAGLWHGRPFCFARFTRTMPWAPWCSSHDAVGAVVLVGPLVLAPAGYLLVLVIAAVSIGLAFASWMIGKARRAAPNAGSAVRVRPARGRAGRWLANGTAALALSASILVAGFECLLAAPYIAEPTGPAGDRVVVVERTSFWRATVTCI